jgi:NADH:ubiquinone oxidoreductase subunit 3 (subunit A)
MAAAVWHMGRWIAFVLFSAVVLSAALVTVAIADALPPESPAEKALKRH